MGYSTGTLKYHYQVKIDLENLVDEIAKKIDHIDDGYDYEIDGDQLIISACDTTGYKHWHYKATLESPSEDEFILDDSIDNVNVECAVLDALHEIPKIKVSVDIDEDYDFSSNMPDEDAIYDNWKDAVSEE